MKIQDQSFKGVAPAVAPRYLPAGAAQVALNAEAFGQHFSPIHAAGERVTTLSRSGNIQTIYRFGQDLEDDSGVWFAWDSDVDVCRGQISGDTAEWTFYTGDGVPKGTTNSLALGAAPPVNWRRLGIPQPPKPNVNTPQVEPETTQASVWFSPSTVSSFTTDTTFQTSLDRGQSWQEVTGVSPTSPSSVVAGFNRQAGIWARLEDDGAIKVFSDVSGESATLWVRYGPPDNIRMLQGTGTTEDLGTPETRVYVWTWISTLDGLTMESAPSPPSDNVTVYPGGSVTITGLSSSPGTAGVVVTGIRIYRSTEGTYLFVDEIPAFSNSYTDTKDADELGEELPSLDWSMPPDNLKGLTNLPNGMMAGFVGRDIYLCEPFRPYAWPESYILTVDSPIVGLGRMDTTLAVLTEGNPYFVQGSDPALMTMVQSDIEQACVSKRSIVSLDGAVFYAAPDGLMMLSSSGSRLVTQELFKEKQWREHFNPSSIHAYGYDRQYIAFYQLPNGDKGGFIYDLRSQQFVMHELWYPTAYTDLRNDTLYIYTTENNAKEIMRWRRGERLVGKYKSKRFSMPQRRTFSCAQIEADEYPITFTIYADGELHYTTIVESRKPFRLPVGQLRDWEYEFEAPGDVFNVVIAQSMEEIASG